MIPYHGSYLVHCRCIDSSNVPTCVKSSYGFKVYTILTNAGTIYQYTIALEHRINATVGTDRPSSKQVAKYSRYNNGTNNITAGTERLTRKQLALYGYYNNRTTTSSILAKYSR